MRKPWRSEIGVPNVLWGARGPGSLATRVRPEAPRKLGPPALARSSKKILDPWSFEAWKFGHVWELGGLDAWKLEALTPHSRMPRRGQRTNHINLIINYY